MNETVEIDPRVRWEIHDGQVRERRASGWRWVRYGLLLALIGCLSPIFGWFGLVGLVGLILAFGGIWKLMRAGRLSADVVRELEARRAK